MPSPNPMKILHVITDLNMGGAEMVLFRLLASQDQQGFSSQVVSLTDVGSLGERISSHGIPISSLGVRPGFPSPRLVTGLVESIRAWKPDLIQSWMYHADLSAGIAAKWVGNPPLVWGLHHTVANRKSLKPATYAVARVNAWLSYSLPVKVVCCAEATRRTHIGLGYDPARMITIPNGIDVTVFRPDPIARYDVRMELGQPADIPLIGLCARFDPLKDFENFIKAAGLLHAKHPEVHFVLWGSNVDSRNENLGLWLKTAGVEKVVHLLGFRQDTPRLMASLDIFGLSSLSEAFPLVVGETMACAVPCVVTDVGDSAVLVGETGKVVPARDPIALADAWESLLARSLNERKELGSLARQQIIDHYSLEKMTATYNQLYRDIIAGSNVK
jgi:glycosyltransferase involved in cell wall biosynthesis